MLCGNFSTTRLTDIHNKYIVLDPIAFLPQTNTVSLQKATDDEKRCSNEDIADIVANQKKHPKMSLKMIGIIWREGLFLSHGQQLSHLWLSSWQ